MDHGRGRVADVEQRRQAGTNHDPDLPTRPHMPLPKLHTKVGVLSPPGRQGGKAGRAVPSAANRDPKATQARRHADHDVCEQECHKQSHLRPTRPKTAACKWCCKSSTPWPRTLSRNAVPALVLWQIENDAKADRLRDQLPAKRRNAELHSRVRSIPVLRRVRHGRLASYNMAQSRCGACCGWSFETDVRRSNGKDLLLTPSTKP